MNPVNNASQPPRLRIDGEVAHPLELNFNDLESWPQNQIVDVSRLVPGREGDAVTLAAILQRAQPNASAKYLTLHSQLDDFHASIPLDVVQPTALLIFRWQGAPLARQKGGPFRFWIPNHDACQMSEVDECANVKYVDHIELTAGKGFDNRPMDEKQHAALHDAQHDSQ